VKRASKIKYNPFVKGSLTVSSKLVQELINLLECKERLLVVSLREGTMLQRDDPEFLRCIQRADGAVGECEDREKRQRAKRILAHIRQFNPFNTSDMEDNEILSEVIEDFLNFSRDRIEKLRLSPK